MTQHELYKTLPRHSQKLNPHLAGVGALLPTKPKPLSPQALVNRPRIRKSGKRMVVVSLVRYGRNTLDDDNLKGSLKFLRDAIAATLGVDDADARVHWEYGQIETKGVKGCTVKVELL